MLINQSEYFQVLEQIKEQIHDAQYRAVLGANKEQILLYWNIGRVIIENTRYGAKFIENLALDIKSEFPNAKGYSSRNLKYMRKFAELVSDEEKVQTVSALLTWSHNRQLFDKTSSLDEYIWYATQLTSQRDRLTAEYALRDINKPIGVSEYRLSDFVPQELADTLPSAEDIERRLKSKYDIKDDGEEGGGGEG